MIMITMMITMTMIVMMIIKMMMIKIMITMTMMIMMMITMMMMILTKLFSFLRYHKDFPELIPDLRVSQKNSRKYFFYGYHTSVFRG